MNKVQIHKKEMYDAVVSYLDTNAALWSSIAKVGEFKNEFSDVVVQIDEAQYAQQQAQVEADTAEAAPEFASLN